MSQQTEIWKPILGFEGLYEISNMGRVYSIPRTVKRSNDTICSVAGKYKSVFMGNAGYYMVTLYKDGIRNCNTLHYFMAITFIGEQQNDDQVNHKDGNKTNNSPDNLEWVSASDNIIHSYNSKLSKKAHSVTKELLLQIIESRYAGKSFTEIADLYNLNWHYVQKIFMGKRHRVLLKEMGYEHKVINETHSLIKI
jgi:hypothetical protein